MQFVLWTFYWIFTFKSQTRQNVFGFSRKSSSGWQSERFGSRTTNEKSLHLQLKLTKSLRSLLVLHVTCISADSVSSLQFTNEQNKYKINISMQFYLHKIEAKFKFFPLAIPYWLKWMPIEVVENIPLNLFNTRCLKGTLPSCSFEQLSQTLRAKNYLNMFRN